MATVKDPFGSPPTIPDAQEEEWNEEHIDDSEDMKKGAPRNLIATLSKFGMPIAFIGIAAWLFWPQESQNAKFTKAPIDYTVDETRQVSNTSELLKSLNEEAKLVPVPPELVVHTGNTAGNTSAISNSNFAQPLTPPGNAPEIDVALQKRKEEIRASTLEAGAFKLVADNSQSLGAPKLDALQAEMAVQNASRNDAVARVEAMQNKAMSALNGGGDKPKVNPDAEFLTNQSALSGAHEVLRQQHPTARYIVNQNHVIRTALLTGINSDLPGTISARLTADVYDSRQEAVVWPKGSLIVGAYSSQIVVGQSRVLVAINRLILPNGDWVSLQAATGASLTGESGLEADVNNHFWKMFSSSAMVGAASLLLPNTKQFVTQDNNNGGSSSGGATIAMALNDVLKTLLERNKNMAPTLSVKPGSEFIFLMAKDVAAQPWVR